MLSDHQPQPSKGDAGKLGWMAERGQPQATVGHSRGVALSARPGGRQEKGLLFAILTVLAEGHKAAVVSGPCPHSSPVPILLWGKGAADRGGCRGRDRRKRVGLACRPGLLETEEGGS